MRSISLIILLNLFIMALLSAELNYSPIEEDIKRIPANDYIDLPKELRTFLVKNNCLVPQVKLVKEKHNIISGNFGKGLESDWAVLCSNKTEHSLLIFWDNKFQNPEVVSTGKDTAYMQGGIGFSHMISIADKKFIMDHYIYYGGEKPPEIKHLGINDAFYGKYSIILYFHEGKWLELTGSD